MKSYFLLSTALVLLISTNAQAATRFSAHIDNTINTPQELEKKHAEEMAALKKQQQELSEKHKLELEALKLQLSSQQNSASELPEVKKLKYKDKIARLEMTIKNLREQLKALSQQQGSAIPVISSELKNKVSEFKEALSKSQNIELAKVDQLLELIKNEASAETALDLNEHLLKEFEHSAQAGDQAKLEHLGEILGKLTDHTYIGKVIEKETIRQKKEARKQLFLEGVRYYNAIKAKGLSSVTSSPSLILMFIHPSSLNLIKSEQLIKLKSLWKYSSKEDLLAIHYYLGELGKIDPKNLTGEGKPLEAFLIEIEEYIHSFKSQQKLIPNSVNDKIASALIRDLSNYIEVDFKEREKKILQDYAAEYAKIKDSNYINQHLQEAPLLILLEKDKALFSKLPRTIYDLLKDYTQFTTLDELKALVGHFAHLNLISNGTNDTKSFANSLYNLVQERTKNGIEGRNPIPSVEVQTFKKRIADKFLN